DRDDCYYNPGSGCTGFTNNPSPWGYGQSPDAACHGWGSKRTAPCDNPRLDEDNISCDPKIADPMNTGGVIGSFGAFCSPENMNLDNPKNGEKFVVGVHFYSTGAILGAAPPSPKPHVNVYCNGERRLAFGYDPTTVPPHEFPVLKKAGADPAGDLWEVATVEAKVTGVKPSDCVLTPIHVRAPNA